MRVSVLF